MAAATAVTTRQGNDQFRGLFSDTWSVSCTLDVGSLIDGAGETETIAVPGVALGDAVIGFSFGIDKAGVVCHAYVSAANVVPDYFERVHEELCILVQAESLVALEHLDEILAVDGVDGVFIGPADLSADMGFAGTVNRPEVRVRIEAAIRQIRGSGKAAGFLWTNLDDCQHWIDIGTSFLAVASDSGILARASDGLTKRFKS